MGIGAGELLEILEDTDSTNRVALERAAEGAPHGTTIVARRQTARLADLGRIDAVQAQLAPAPAFGRLHPHRVTVEHTHHARVVVFRPVSPGAGGQHPEREGQRPHDHPHPARISPCGRP